MPTYERNKKAAQKYLAKFDCISARSPKEDGLREVIHAHVARTGESLNEFVLRAIRETIHRDLHPSSLMDDGTPPAIAAYLSNKKAGE